MNFRSIAWAVTAFLIALPAVAGDAAGFAGTWELNPNKGENLGMVAAVKETLVISAPDDQLVLDFTDVFQGKTTTRQVTYDLQGESMDNFAAMGDPSVTVTRWDGDRLVTTWTSEGAIAGTEVVRTETRELSADGDEMTVTTVRGDNPAMVMVYDRQQ